MKPAAGILVYDDNCPLCSAYSSLFVRYGFLPAEGRRPFSTLDPESLSLIVFEKSRNEIPLLNPETGKVLYGIDALLEILGQRFPLIKKTGHLRPIHWFLCRLYKLVSYNRKVIVAKKCGPGKIDCTPDLNYFYRLLLMALGLVFNTIMLFPLHTDLLTGLSYYHLTLAELQLAHFGLVLVNCCLALRFNKEKAVDYLCQVNMLALVTILLLLIPFFSAMIWANESFITACLVIITIIVFKEYLRRMEYAGVLNTNKWMVSINLASLTGFIMVLFG